MTTFLLVALLSGGFLWLLSRRGSEQSVLAILPVGLLFFTAPLTAAVLQLIRGFQVIAEEGRGGGGAVTPLAAGIVSAVWLGAIGFLITMALAAVLQLSASDTSDDPVEGERLAPAKRRDWMPAGSSILIVPVAFYAFRTQNIPAIVTGFTQALEHGQQLSPTQMVQMSRTLSRDCVTAVVAGGILSTVLVAAAAVNLVAVRRQGARRPGPTGGWF